MTKYEFLEKYIGHLAPADREGFESDLDDMVSDAVSDAVMEQSELDERTQ